MELAVYRRSYQCLQLELLKIVGIKQRQSIKKADKVLLS